MIVKGHPCHFLFLYESLVQRRYFNPSYSDRMDSAS